MNERSKKVFIDSNMLIFGATFQQENVFEWMSQLYADIYIHKEVYSELGIYEIRESVDRLIESGEWTLFDPASHPFFNSIEQEIYQQRLIDVQDAFHLMNMNRISQGRMTKSISNLGEIATIAACLMVGARIICSNDFDIREIVEQEDYRIAATEEDILIIQDSAEDFCTKCCQNEIASRKLVRKFYKTIICESYNRVEKLTQLDNRLDEKL